MTHGFLTVANSVYLPRALVLWRSLREADPAVDLHLVAMDDAALRLLARLDLPGIVITSLDELEIYDPALQAVKSQRTSAEYCMTAKPSACLYALERTPGLETITFLDADLCFYRSPLILPAALADASILLMPHRRASTALDREHGVFNSGTVTFACDSRGLGALRLWRDRCVEWCHLRVDAGRYGDQKYLEELAQRFGGVHVLDDITCGVAPWNASRHTFSERSGQILIDDQPMVFYHFALLYLFRGGLRAARAGLLPVRYRHVGGPFPFVWRRQRLTVPRLGERELELVWEPYLRRLGESLASLRSLDRSLDLGLTDLSSDFRVSLELSALERLGVGARRACNALDSTREALRRADQRVARVQGSIKRIDRRIRSYRWARAHDYH